MAVLESFSGGMVGKRGQFRQKNLREVFQHAENLLVERDGSLRSRPALQRASLGIPTLPTDSVLRFIFNNRTYTIVYDPLYMVTYKQNRNPGLAKILSPPDPKYRTPNNHSDKIFPHERVSRDAAMRPTFLASERYGIGLSDISYSGIKTNSATLRKYNIADQSFRNLIREQDQMTFDAEYKLYIRMYLNRIYQIIDTHWLWVGERGEVRGGYPKVHANRETYFTNRFSSVSIDKHSYYWTRFLMYDDNGKIVCNGVTRTLPESTIPPQGVIPETLTPSMEQSGSSFQEKINSTTFPDFHTLDSFGVPLYRSRFRGNYSGYNQDAEVNVGASVAVLSDDSGFAGPIFIDLSKLQNNEVASAYDFKCAYTPESWHFPSYMTHEEFLLYRSTFAEIATDRVAVNDDIIAYNGIRAAATGRLNAAVDASVASYEKIVNAEKAFTTNAASEEANQLPVVAQANSDILRLRRLYPPSIGKMTWHGSLDGIEGATENNKTVGLGIGITPYWRGYPLVRWYEFGPGAVFRLPEDPTDPSQIKAMRDSAFSRSGYLSSGDNNARTTKINSGSYLTYFNYFFDCIGDETGRNTGAEVHGANTRDWTGTEGPNKNIIVVIPRPWSPLVERTTTNVVRWLNVFTSYGTHWNAHYIRSSSSGLYYRPTNIVRGPAVSARKFIINNVANLRKLWNVLRQVESDSDVLEERYNTYAGFNYRDYPTITATFFSRIILSGFAFPNQIAASRQLFSTSNVKFDLYARIRAGSNPLVGRGIVQALTPEGGLIIYWIRLLRRRGESGVVVGTSLGDVILTADGFSVDALKDANLDRQSNPPTRPPVQVLGATYQLIQNNRDVFLLEYDDIAKRNKLITVTAPIQDFITEGINQLWGIDNSARLIIRSGSRVFIGLVYAGGDMAWSEISVPRRDGQRSSIHSVQLVGGQLYIDSEIGNFTLDFSETSPIEEDSEVSITLCSPLAYYIRENQSGLIPFEVPFNVEDYNYARGQLLGKFLGKTFVSTTEQDGTVASSYRNHCDISPQNLKNYDSAIKFTFEGREIQVDCAIVGVST